MTIALDELRLRRLFVVYPGRRSYRLVPKIEALSVVDLPAALTSRT